MAKTNHIPTLLYTQADRKVREEIEKELKIPDPEDNDEEDRSIKTKED